MLKVLIIEDDSVKAGKLKEFVQTQGCESKVTSSKREAIAAMLSDLYDLALLDLFIPDEFGDDPSPDNAYNLLQRLNNDRRLKKPLAVCGITRYSEIDVANEKFKEYLGDVLIKYEEGSDAWKAQVRGKIEYLKVLSRMRPQKNPYDYDVAIITALQKIESEQLRKVFGGNWEALAVEGDDTTTYYTSELEVKSGEKIRIVTCYQQLMASVSCSMLLQK